MEPLNLADPVIGFRLWNVADDRLVPIARADPWAPETSEAKCSRYGSTHDAPVESCGCGLYALHELPDLVEGSVRGAVVMWGRLVVHHAGVRAQFARPVALVRGDLPPPTLEQLAHTYGIHVVDEDALPGTAAEWGNVIPLSERPCSPLDLLVDVLDRSGFGSFYAHPVRHGSLTMRLLEMLRVLSGSSDGAPRPGESWESWWCRACDAVAISRESNASLLEIVARMRALPSADASLEEPRVVSGLDTWRGVRDRDGPEPDTETDGGEPVSALLEALVVGLENEPRLRKQGGFLADTAPLSVANRRAGKAVTRNADALALLALPAAKGWCTPNEQALALQIAIEEDDDALLGRSVPLVADLLTPERLVAVLATARQSRTITGALRRLDPKIAQPIADSVLERAEVLALHEESLILASDTAARQAIDRHVQHNTHLLRMQRVRELVPTEQRDKLLLAAAAREEDPAARLSCFSALSDDIAPFYVARLLKESADAPFEAWIRMYRGLERVAPQALDAIEKTPLHVSLRRLSRYPEETAELLAAWPSAPLECATAALHASRPIGSWRRASLLRKHPQSMDPTASALLESSDGSPRVRVSVAQTLVALFVAAPTSSELRHAAQRVAADQHARLDIRIAASWRARVESWPIAPCGDHNEPEVVRLFHASVCFQRASEFIDPFSWREAGLTHPALPPASGSR